MGTPSQPPLSPFVPDRSANEKDEMARHLTICQHPHGYVWERKETVSCTEGILKASEMQLTTPQSMTL